MEASRKISTGVQVAPFYVPVSLVDSLVDSVESPIPGLTHALWLEAISPYGILFVVCFRTRVYWMLRLLTPNRTSRAPSSHMAKDANPTPCKDYCF